MRVWNRLSRLSITLRSRDLAPEERAAFQQDLRRGASVRELYTRSVDAWLDRSFFERIVTATFPGEFFTNRTETLFIGPLATYPLSGKRDEHVLYYLPSIHGARRAGDEPPCGPAQYRTVRPWWSSKDEIVICDASYRPEHAFDEVGYCAGRSELTITSTPRNGCGCGPMLLACLPPESVRPHFVDDLDEAVIGEVAITGGDILDSGRPYSDILTTSTTWQNGLVDFLYKRREMLAAIASGPHGEAVEARLRKMAASIDLDAPGRWVERVGVYAKGGIYFGTPSTQASVPTYRTMARTYLGAFLCAQLKGVNVDSQSLLEGVKSQHADLRAFDITESPMRKQKGCSSCHAPMDSMAGFFGGLRTPLFGAYPTGRDTVGELYVNGSEDYRGTETGYAGLSRLLIAQPEFDVCAVQRFAAASGMSVSPARRQELVTEFKKGGRNVKSLIRTLLLDPSVVSSE